MKGWEVLNYQGMGRIELSRGGKDFNIKGWEGLNYLGMGRIELSRDGNDISPIKSLQSEL